MTASLLSSTGSLPLVVVVVGVLVAGAIAGLLASLVLLRYADTTWAGWLLGVGNAHPDSEDDGDSASASSAIHSTSGPATVGTASTETGASANEAEPLDHLAADFAVHAQAVRAQVSRYADLLADGDAVLRARLRRLEDGGSASASGSRLGGTSGSAW